MQHIKKSTSLQLALLNCTCAITRYTQQCYLYSIIFTALCELLFDERHFKIFQKIKVTKNVSKKL